MAKIDLSRYQSKKEQEVKEETAYDIITKIDSRLNEIVILSVKALNKEGMSQYYGDLSRLSKGIHDAKSACTDVVVKMIKAKEAT